MKRHDEEYFGGLREKVLQRDEYACRVCHSTERVLVHHRKKGISTMKTMISLCLKHHLMVHKRTMLIIVSASELLRALWREQHPDGTEQYGLDYAASLPLPANRSLFDLE